VGPNPGDKGKKAPTHPEAPGWVKDKVAKSRWSAPGQVRRGAVGMVPPPSARWTYEGSGDGLESVVQATGGRAAPHVAAPERVAAVDPDEAVAAPGLGVQGHYGMEEFKIREGLSVAVNVANGNLVVRSTDLKFNGPGIGTSWDRFYNGLATRTGAFGGKWSLSGGHDVGLEVGTSTVVFRGPSGFRATFTGSGSTWTAPTGVNAKLIKNADGSWSVRTNGTGETLKFTAGGYLIQHNDRNGVGLKFYYGSTTQIQSVVDAAGRTSTFTYDAAKRITKLTDSAGRAITYAYDAAGRLASDTNANGETTSYTYDANGRLARITTARGVTLTIGYQAGGRVWRVNRWTGMNATGTANGTDFAYAAGSSTQTNPNGKKWTYAIDAVGRVTKVTDPLGRARSASWTANSMIATTTDAMGAGGTGGNITKYTWDTANNPTQVQIPTGAVTSAVYTTGGACASTDSANPDRPKCLTDDAGNKTSMAYDAVGNLTSKTDTTATGGAALKYTWSVPGSTDGTKNCSPFAGQLCTITKGNGNVTRYTYNANGDLTKITPPSPLGVQSFEYDSLGRMTASVNGRGHRITYTWDNQDRKVSYSIPDTPAGNPWTNYLTYDADGNVTYNQSTLEYDALNRLVSMKTPAHANPSTVGYDPAGNVTTSTDPDGNVTTYTYDAANQVTTAGFPGATCAQDLVSQAGCVKFGYNANGLENKRVMPANVVQDVTYDNSSRVTRTKAGSPNQALLNDFAYTYTAAGADRTQVQTMTDHVGYTANGATVIAKGAVTSYGYDSLKRLTSAVEKTPAGAASASFTYAYDKNGNRTSYTRSGNLGGAGQPGTTSYGYNAADQLTTLNGDASKFSYDADGNELTAAGDTAVGVPNHASEWTADHVATAMTTNTSDRYEYGYVQQSNQGNLMWWNHGSTQQRSPIGLDTTRTDNAGTTKYLLSPSGKPLAYKWAPNGGDWKTDPGLYYLTDRQGSITSTATGDHGLEAAIYRYSPYGEWRVADEHYDGGTKANRIQFHGLLYDDATGLYRTDTRWYDPTTGRFTQPDTTAYETNPYLYAAGNPSNATDRSGKKSIGDAVGDVAGEVAGAGLGLVSKAGPVGLGVALAGGCIAGVAAEGIGNYIDGERTSGGDVALSCASVAAAGFIGRAVGKFGKSTGGDD